MDNLNEELPVDMDTIPDDFFNFAEDEPAGAPQEPVVVPPATEAPVAAGVSPSPSQPVAPQAPAPAAPAAPSPAVPAQPVPNAAAAPVGVQAPAAPAQQVSPSGPPAAPQDIQAVRAKAIDEIASSIVFTPEEREALMMTDDGARVMSRLAAQVTVRAYENAFSSVVTALGPLIDQYLSSREANTNIWNGFFSQYKHLEPQRQGVYDIARAYRAANPQHPAEQLMREIAALAEARFNLAPARVEPPVQPASVPMARPVAAPPRPPVAPAAVGGVPNGQPNEYAQFIEELQAMEARGEY